MVFSRNIISLLVTASLLTACGGGSDSAATPTPPPDNNLPASQCDTPVQWAVVETTDNIAFLTELTYQTNQPGVIIAQLTENKSSGMAFKWQQVAGDGLSLINNMSPVLSFTAANSGEYQFKLTVTGNGPNITQFVTVNVNNAQQSSLAVNSDHQVVEGNNVSVRLARINGEMPTNIDWCTYSGDNVNLDLSNTERPLFVAPNVDQDTVISIRASAEFNGQTVTDDVHILVTNEANITSPYFDTPLARTYAYKSNSVYSDQISKCTYSNTLNNSCSISQLPLIGQQTTTPTISDIMDRVVVSHDWMGRNFELFLQQQDPHGDFITLLQSVSAIVISYDIRPSFYWVVTGAIYLDPENLWLTPSERDSINEAPDYRSDFGNDLQFLMPWRYVKNNQYAYSSYPYENRSNRTIEDFTPRLASLLYHELAHANDFFPRSVHADIQGPTLLDDFYKRTNNKALISDQLSNLSPLQSSEMYGLANVSFKGEIANATQKSYVPSDVTSFFKPDHASDYYAYSSTREDVAMLFEEALMSHRYTILRDVAVTDAPENASGSTITVNWGQRGRIGESTIKPRAEFVITEILPEVDSANLINNLPAPLALTPGRSWLENLTLISNNGFAPQKVNHVQQDISLQERPLELSGSQHR